MKHCLQCGSEVSQHAQQCGRCGHHFETANTLLANSGADGSSDVDSGIMQLGPALEFTLYIGRDRVIMPFPVNGRLILGRAASSVETTVLTSPTEHNDYLSLLGDKPIQFRYFLEFLSLTSFEAELAGVSREHVAIHYDGRALTIEDLGSTNGTRLNGAYLSPGEQYELCEGDTLVLGALPMRVTYSGQRRTSFQQQRTG